MPEETEKPLEEPEQSSSLISSPDEEEEDLEPTEDIELDNAVSDIEQKEGDEVLAAEDEKRSEANNSDTRVPWFKKKRVWIPAIFIIILAVVFGIPKTRYTLLGYVLKENYTITVNDSYNNQPVSDATVTLDGVSGQTNNYGKVTLHIKVGTGTLTVAKKYYNNFSSQVLVNIFSKRNQDDVSFVASGRQVPITIINKLTNKPIENATISASGTEAKTDASGNATLVLPASEGTVHATISADGYNTDSASIVITTQKVSANLYQLVPSGNVYFLSNASGKIDVVKTNFDGSNLQTVLAGTGQEDPNSTILRESADGRYLALTAKRSGNYPSLYIISTANNNLVTADSGSSDFTLIGWTSSDYIVYKVDHPMDPFGQAGKAELKSYDAETDQLYQLDSTAGSGTSTTGSYEEYYAEIDILANDTVIYCKGWNGAQGNNAAVTVATIQANDTSKQPVKTFTVPPYAGYPQGLEASPSSVLYKVSTVDSSGNPTDMYFLYQDGAMTDQTANAALITNTYSGIGESMGTTYLTSPDAQHAAWDKFVNGHTAIYVGDVSGNGKSVATLDSIYGVYGWLTKDYLLVQKNHNELYIMPTSGITDQSQLVKIGNYLD